MTNQTENKTAKELIDSAVALVEKLGAKLRETAELTLAFAFSVDKLVRVSINSASAFSEADALFIVGFIPSTCPFERDVYLYKLKLFHIPPICKINPYYKEIVNLKLRAIDSLLLDHNYELINGKFTSPEIEAEFEPGEIPITDGHGRSL